MTLWSPEYRIKADGIDVTNVSLAGFTITRGRSDINAPTVPSYCRLDLINFDNTTYAFTINTAITIEVKKTNGSYVYLFGGRISDISTQVQAAGSTTNYTSISITALGLISRLSRSIFTGTLSEDLDGAQIEYLIINGISKTWNSVAPSLTWNTYSTSETWNTAEPAIGEIDPGVYTMRSQTLSSVYISDLITDIAQSAGGFIYEDNQGRICYADEDHRAAYLSANGYTSIDARQAIATGISSISRQGDIVNQYTINHGNNFSSSHTVNDLESQGLYGLFAQATNSYLKNTADVETLAERIIALRSFPYSRFQSITFPLQSPEIGDATRDALLQINPSLPIEITNLPINIQGGLFQGFIEGWTWRSTVKGLSLTINASPTAFNIPAIRWEQVNGAEAWNTISTTLQWEDAIGAIS